MIARITSWLNRPCWGHTLSLAIILTIALILRLWGITSQTLWIDELFSWKLARFPVSELLERCATESTVHPPLYFLILHGWMKWLGDSEFALRLLAVVFSLVQVVGVYVLAYLLSRPHAANAHQRTALCWPALLAAGLLACNPPQIHLAQQVRGYTLAFALLVWASVLLIWTLRQRDIVPYHGWVFYGLLGALALYTHYLASIIIFAQYVYAAIVLFEYWRGSRKAIGKHLPNAVLTLKQKNFSTTDVAKQHLAGLIGSLLVIAVMLAPWLTTAWVHVESAYHSHYSPYGSRWLLRSIRHAIAGNGIMAVGPSSPLDYVHPALIAFFLVCLAVHRRSESWFVLTCGALPLAVLWIASWFSWRDLFWSRYLSFIQIWWLIGVALVLGRWWWPVRMLLAMAISVYFLYVTYSLQGRVLLAPPPDVPRAAVDIIRQRYTPPDPVIITKLECYYRLAYELRDLVKPRILLPYRMHRELLPGGSSHLADDDVIYDKYLPYLEAPGVWIISCRRGYSEEPQWQDVAKRWQLVFSEYQPLENPGSCDLYVVYYRLRR